MCINIRQLMPAYKYFSCKYLCMNIPQITAQSYLYEYSTAKYLLYEYSAHAYA